MGACEGLHWQGEIFLEAEVHELRRISRTGVYTRSGQKTASAIATRQTDTVFPRARGSAPLFRAQRAKMPLAVVQVPARPTFIVRANTSRSTPNGSASRDAKKKTSTCDPNQRSQ